MRGRNGKNVSIDLGATLGLNQLFGGFEQAVGNGVRVNFELAATNCFAQFINPGLVNRGAAAGFARNAGCNTAELDLAGGGFVRFIVLTCYGRIVVGQGKLIGVAVIDFHDDHLVKRFAVRTNDHVQQNLSLN